MIKFRETQALLNGQLINTLFTVTKAAEQGNRQLLVYLL